MSISLQKGQKVSLSKDNAGLSKIIVGLGWDEVQQSSSGGGFLSALFGGGSKQQPIDCDASALMLKNGKLAVSYTHLLAGIADTDKDFRKVKRMILKTFKYLMDGRDKILLCFCHIVVIDRIFKA